MEQRERTVQLITRESEHRHNKSIQMNGPTRCQRQNNFYKEQIDTTCRHDKQRDNVCTQRIDGNAQTVREWYFAVGQYSSLCEGTVVSSLSVINIGDGVPSRVQVEC